MMKRMLVVVRVLLLVRWGSMPREVPWLRDSRCSQLRPERAPHCCGNSHQYHSYAELLLAFVCAVSVSSDCLRITFLLPKSLSQCL
jgi:hypothetical protein